MHIRTRDSSRTCLEKSNCCPDKRYFPGRHCPRTPLLPAQGWILQSLYPHAGVGVALSVPARPPPPTSLSLAQEEMRSDDDGRTGEGNEVTVRLCNLGPKILHEL